MSELKRCPKCGSTNISPLVFYHPSIWKCSDCGYEGAFIIEGNAFAEEIQKRYRKRGNIIYWAERKLRMSSSRSSSRLSMF